jgi:hypothetical protein
MKESTFILILVIFIVTSCGQSKNESDAKRDERDYIFFLHNKFIEEHELDDEHPEYGRAEYAEIINSFEKDDFIVLSDKRDKDTDVEKYAGKIVLQIDSLLAIGIKPNHVTVIGTSKGGYIAQFVSTMMANPDLNFVFIGSFQETDIENHPEINFCGNILTIYEASDVYGVSAVKRKETSKLKINKFKEIELHTNLKHGFLFKALPEWIEPSKMWAKRNYEMK